MRFLLLYVIRLYWAIIPEHKRRNCLFSETCSQFVFRIFLTEGVLKGFIAFKSRFLQCKPGYQVFRDERLNVFKMQLRNGIRINEQEISPRLLPPYSYNYELKNSQVKE